MWKKKNPYTPCLQCAASNALITGVLVLISLHIPAMEIQHVTHAGKTRTRNQEKIHCICDLRHPVRVYQPTGKQILDYMISNISSSKVL